MNYSANCAFSSRCFSKHTFSTCTTGRSTQFGSFGRTADPGFDAWFSLTAAGKSSGLPRRSSQLPRSTSVLPIGAHGIPLYLDLFVTGIGYELSAAVAWVTGVEKSLSNHYARSIKAFSNTTYHYAGCIRGGPAQHRNGAVAF